MNNCAYCGKKTDRPKFCCNKHKDRFHNENNPRGIYAHLHPDNRINSEKDTPIFEMRDAEFGEWDHGDCGIY